MEFTFAILFIAVAIVIILIDLQFAVRSYKEATAAGTQLGRAAVLAALVTGTYLLSIVCTDYFVASLMCSLYFLCIDWMLLTLLKFVTILSRRAPLEKDIPLMWVLRAMALADSIILLINPFHEIAIHYVPIQSVIAHFQYEKHLLYNLHLAFTYLLVLGVVGILIRRILRTPQRYRNQFIYITASILIVVAVNAVFILPEKTSLYTLLDYSVIGYSVTLFALYWCCFSYSKTYMLEGLSKSVFDNVSQGIILFDYMEYLVMYNQRLQEIMPQIKLRSAMPMHDFLEQTEIRAEKLEGRSTYSEQLFARKGDMLMPVRCEYRKMLDERDNVIGQLFVLSDDSQEMDMLTGFQSWDHFCRCVEGDAGFIRWPYAVAVFDINGLASINRRLGKEIGDRRIYELAGKIRQAMPEKVRLVRGYDAILIAICEGIEESDLQEHAMQVISSTNGRVQMGLAEAEDEFDGVRPVINRAIRAMQNRKLLDPEASRSQALVSLVRALKECDDDTEAHVHRTENMGCELGRRLHLNDLQMSQLSLLCLLHDIGKIGIPLEILNKPGRLNNEEWAVMQTHVEKGYQIAISARETQDIAEMIRAHHERWDGHGYLRQLKEEEIPLLSRIISVVDSYDAMVNDRVYRPALPVDEAKAEIRRCSGKQFDPAVAKEFLQMLEDKPWIAVGVNTDGTHVGARAGTAASAAAAPATEVRPATGAPTGVAGKPPGLPGSTGAPDADIAAVTGIVKTPPDSEDVRSYAVKYSRYQLDVDNVILEVDDNFEAMTGYTKEDIKKSGLSQNDLIAESDRLEYVMNVDQQMSRGDIIYIEHDIVRKDGRMVHVYCCGRRYFDAATKSIHADIIIVDAASTHHGKIKMKM